MEAYKIKGPAKSIILPNGAEITYAERGEQHEVVAICGAFYHNTFMPVVEGLAQRYHVYAVVMRFDGVTDQKNPDGTTHWGNQWGKDIYDFAQALGIQKFHYIGKCHGTIPGWYLFGSIDPLFKDYLDSNMRLWELTRGCHFTILQGECHLMELDCPDRVVDEAFAFIDQAHKDYD